MASLGTQFKCKSYVLFNKITQTILAHIAFPLDFILNMMTQRKTYLLLNSNGHYTTKDQHERVCPKIQICKKDMAHGHIHKY